MSRLHFKNNSILDQKVESKRANALTVKQNIDWVFSSGENTLLAKENCERADIVTLGQPEFQVIVRGEEATNHRARQLFVLHVAQGERVNTEGSALSEVHP
jgi:hypothetical protein